MELKDALATAMKKNNMKDAHVAVLLGTCSAAVQAWRLGHKQPRFVNAQKLRHVLPGFSDLVDGRVHHAA